jgi:DNA-binding NtrC family response regulator
MSDTSLNVLIVDDDALLRMSLLQTLTLAGYKVRSVDGGHAALSEIDRETPDLLLSDLNMPGLSGFELLSVVRRRFPAIQVIAMSGAYFGDNVPPGVFADAFYEKGRGVRSLMQIVANVAGSGRSLDTQSIRHLADA